LENRDFFGIIAPELNKNMNQNENIENQSQAGETPADTRKAWQKAVGALLLVVIGYTVGFQNGKSGFQFEPKDFKIVNQADAPREVNYDLLWKAIDAVNSKYIEKKPTPEQFLYGAIKGAVESTGDPYTTFFTPQEFESFKSDLRGSFDGIGAEIAKRDGYITIVAPIDDSPAKKAGVLAKDIILEVDGKSTTGWSVEEAVSKIRGTRGTKVKLQIAREGRTKPFDIEIVRDKIEIKSVKLEYKDLNNKKIAVLTISRFGDDTDQLFEKYANEILRSNASGLVVDLRNNPGGYLQTAVDLASQWVKPGEVVVTEERTGSQPFVYNSKGNSRLGSLKTVVLINGGSASASEILAGALRDHNLAQLVGETSFGKGSVQELVELDKKSAVKITVARWITPGGKNLNKEGLHPDVEVKLSEDDIKNSKDPQMDKALEELTK
jgi:carboxyl-terminal processing protease